jgi:hypothetical protein
MKEQGEERCNSTVPSDTALDGGGINTTNRPLHCGNDSTLCTDGFVGPRAGLERCKNPTRAGIRFPAHLGRREWLYPLMPYAEITPAPSGSLKKTDIHTVGGI